MRTNSKTVILFPGISAALLAAFTATILSAGQHPLDAAARSKVARDYGNLPVQFEENAGQTDGEVKYLARGGGYTLFLTEEEAVMSLRRSELPKEQGGTLRMQMLGANKQAALQGLDALPGRVNYLTGKDRANWRTGIATYAKVKYEQLYPGIDLIFYGKDGRLEYDFVLAPGADPSTIRLGLNGAAPQVDSNGNLVLTAGSEKVSFLKPVLYQMNGSKKERVSGSFLLARNNEARFQVGQYDRSRALVIDPVLVYASYLGGQRQTNINALAVNGLGQLYVTGFTLASNFPTTPSVVQPAIAVPPDAFVSKISADGKTLLYSTFLGGNSDDEGRSIAVDGNDNAYVIGVTQSNNFPVTADAIQSQCGPMGVASTDPVTLQTVYKTKAPSCESNGTPDVFLAKLNPTGTQLLYSTFLGGNGSDSPTNIRLDSQGNVYVAGSTSSVAGSGSAIYPDGAGVNFPVTPSAFQSDVTGQANWFYAFVTKLSPDLHSILYSSIIGGGNGGSCGNGLCGNFNQAMAVGQNGIVYIGGFTSSPLFPVTPGALQTTCPQCIANSNGGFVADSGFISAFDTTQSGTASLVFSTYLNGTAPSNATTKVHGLATDTQNNVYATGETEANDFPVTAGTYSPTCSYPVAQDAFGRCRDAFVLKLSPPGSLLWSTYYGSSVPYTATSQAIATDSTGNVYIVGGGGVLPGLPQVNPIQAGPNPNGRNLFLATFSMDGSKLLFASYYGGSQNEIPSGIGLDSSGNIYVAGTTGSSDLPTKPDSVYQFHDPGPAYNPFSQNLDFLQGFFLKASCLAPSCPALPSLTINSVTLVVNPNSASAGQAVTLSATVTGQANKPVPTGSVTFYNGPTPVGQAGLDQTGVAAFTTSSLAPGKYALTATYAGDALYLGNTSAAQTLTIAGFQTSTAAAGVSLTFSPNSQAVNLTATVTSGSGVVNGGSVLFTLLGTMVSGPVSNGSASASFTVPGGTTAGAYQIQAAYVPSASFTASSDNAKQLTVAKATPAITFPNPADITPGTALGSAQLNATANVAGTFVYNPPAGTLLPAGNGQTLTATFTPADPADYNGASASALINVKSTAPNATSIAANGVSLTFSPNAQTISLTALVTSNVGAPTGSVQFTLLGMQVSGVLNNGTALASLTVPGGTAAGNYPIQAAYVPTGNFAANSDNSKQLAIAKTTPVITWANPPDIQPGTALSSTQLNATASVPGTFTYNPPTGTVLPIGSGQALSVTFTPTDSTDYNTAAASAQINVKQTTLTMTVTKVTTGSKLTYSSNPQPVVLSALVTSPSGAVKGGSVTFTVGTLFFAGILNAVTTGSAPVINGSATASLTMPGAPAVGFYTVEAVYNPDPTGNFGASGDRQFALEIQAKITWPTPADITFGTALSSDQLNATASFPGSLTYTPTTGTVLPVGRQLLSVHFVSLNSTALLQGTADASVFINVVPAGTPASPPNLVGTTILTRDPVTNEILAQLTISNTGGTTASNVQVTSFRIENPNQALTSTVLPQSLGSIAPGASSIPVTFRLPANLGPAGQNTFVFAAGTYTGYGWTYSGRITIP